MRKKGLLVLLAVTLVVLAAAGWAVRDRAPATATDEVASLLFADLPEHVNDVAQLVIEDADGLITIENRDDTWVLVERGGYPVALDKVQKAVLGLSTLAIEEPKTSRPENFAKLGVEEPGTAESAAKRVTLKDAGGAVVAAAILGETKFRRGSQAIYARRDGEDQVYLCEGRVQLDTKPTSWIERDLIRLEGDRVSDVQIVHPDGEEILIGRDPENESQFLLENTPPDREEKFAGVGNSVGTALTYLPLEDVKPAGEIDFTADPRARSTYTCKDGLVVELELARQDEATWARLNARYQEPPEIIGPVDTEGDEDPGQPLQISDTGEVIATEPEEAEEEEVDPEAVRAEVEELNALWAGWAYSLQEYKAEVLARRMEELLAEVVEPEPEAEPVDGALDLDELLQDEGDEPAAGGNTEEPASGDG